MSIILKRLFLAATLLAPLSAMADGSYVKAGVGRSIYGFGSGFPDEHPTGYLLAYGTQLDTTFGIEGGLVGFGRVDLNDGLGSKLNTHALYLAGTGTYPINAQAAVYGKLGLAVKHYSAAGDSETRSGPVLGVGTRMMFGPEWGAALEHTYYGKNGGLALSQTTIAAIFNF
jgi:hypothetical protein